jgi:hypothetical protein
MKTHQSAIKSIEDFFFPYKPKYGCETWSLTLREERRLRVFEKRVLRRVFGPKRDEVTVNRENYIMRSFLICTPYPRLCGW